MIQRQDRTDLSAKARMQRQRTPFVAASLGGQVIVPAPTAGLLMGATGLAGLALRPSNRLILKTGR